MLLHRRLLMVSTILLVTLFSIHHLERADAAVACEDHPEYDVSPVTTPLRYVGPQQRIHREGKMNFRCFNAQHWEDLYMFQNYFSNVTEGFFIELGALDGWSYSVSYFFEQFLHWKGLLIEASPKNFLQYKAKMRKLPIKRRRRSEYLLSAVCNDPKPLTYVSKEGTGAGILEFMPLDQQERNRKMCQESTQPLGGMDNQTAGVDAALQVAAAEAPGACTLTKIQCIHLGNMLRERGVKKIDMFVLDVEGAELEVLSTLRLDEIPVWFFLIELDGKAPHKDAGVRCILRHHGYEPIGRLDLNEIWRKKDFQPSQYTYGSPVPTSSWSSCFRTQVDAATFFSPGGGAAVDAHEQQKRQQQGGGALPHGGGELDPDFQEMEVVGAGGAAHPNGEGSHKFVYGAIQQEPDSDMSSMFAWLLIICVPILVVLLRRRRRR